MPLGCFLELSLSAVCHHKKLQEIRFVDLCAGLGGFHRALSLVSERLFNPKGINCLFRCVAAAELERDLRECYVSNFPDVRETYATHHSAEWLGQLKRNFPDCAPAIWEEMPEYDADGNLVRVHGDIGAFLSDDGATLRRDMAGNPILPDHDLLCAGFPCQPFSKSGAQMGFEDTRGTVFHMLATILKERTPALVLLENVGNFERHDDGNTWRRVRQILEEDLGYDVLATEHVASGSGRYGLLSPHHFGYPHHRERFFIVAQRREALDKDPPNVRALLARRLTARKPFLGSHRANENPTQILAVREEQAAEALRRIISSPKPAGERENLRASQVSPERTRCINHWGTLLEKLAEMDRAGASPSWRGTMPSFPIWGYELDPWHWYPIDSNPKTWAKKPSDLAAERESLLASARQQVLSRTSNVVDLQRHSPSFDRAWLAEPMTQESVEKWVANWPGYAGRRDEWPRWKQRFIEQNREWALQLWSALNPNWLRDWLEVLFAEIAVPSLQKLEWNCKGEALDLWKQILQFRPSGLRAKRFVHIPALVAMTTTQVPIVPRLNENEPSDGSAPGALGRHLIPSEALQLQGFPADWTLPDSRERAFTCFGNAVHAELVSHVFENWLFEPPQAIANENDEKVEENCQPNGRKRVLKEIETLAEKRGFSLDELIGKSAKKRKVSVTVDPQNS